MAEKPKLNNEHTKQYLKDWFARAVKRAQNPDPRVKMLRKRKAKKSQVAKKFGL